VRSEQLCGTKARNPNDGNEFVKPGTLSTLMCGLRYSIIISCVIVGGGSDRVLVTVNVAVTNTVTGNFLSQRVINYHPRSSQDI